MRSIDIKLYSPNKAERIIEEYAEWIHTLSLRYPIPAACIKAILYQELTEIDVLDVLADLAVKLYWQRYTLRRSLGFKNPTPILHRGIFGKRDSSTGYAQIFAYVGINAVNFALDHGLADCETLQIPSDHRLTTDDPDTLRLIWKRLNSDMHLDHYLGKVHKGHLSVSTKKEDLSQEISEFLRVIQRADR